MIVTALEIEGETESVSFSDADENSWYYDYLCKASGAGLVNGYNDGTFGAGKNITREEMITISYRAALYKNKKFSQSSENFTDDDKISDYAKEAVYSFRTAGIISGSGNNTVNPKNNLTRAEAAKIICLLMEYGGI